MDDAAAEKVARNNALFRDTNDEIEAAAAHHGLDDGRVVPFICECSDVRCTQIVRLTLDEYRRIRSNARWFVHALNHERSVAGVIEPVEETDRFVIVEKQGLAGDLAAKLR